MMKTKINPILMAIFFVCSQQLYSQRIKKQTDKHIVNQQERMVFKQWDKKKFTPTKGFLGLNPLYWLTWAWHPNYPKTDLRPLSPSGNQTQRLLIVAAMMNTEESYKKHTDTLQRVALSEFYNYAGILSQTDPLWQLYYKQEFEPLLNNTITRALEHIPINSQDYLIRSGELQEFIEQSNVLSDRLKLVRELNMDHGSRIVAYHRILMAYRKLFGEWKNKKLSIGKYLEILKYKNTASEVVGHILDKDTKSDIQIANEVINRSKL